MPSFSRHLPIRTPKAKQPQRLTFTDVVPGAGPSPHPGQTVHVRCEVTLPNGRAVTLPELSDPCFFVLGEGLVPAGVEQMVSGMSKGGIRVCSVPPEFGYGNRDAPDGVPTSATLKIEVELLEITHTPPPQPG